MRTHVRPSLLALVALAASAAVAGAQSLGELAAKEKERQEKERQKRGGASKVITENDLGGRSGGTFSNAGSTAAAAATPAASPSPAAAGAEGVKPAEAKEKTPDEIRAEQENDWRQRTAQARDQVTQLNDKVNRLQQALNDVGGNIYSSPRTATLQQFDATKAELATARQKVADLEEEGRRNSYR